MKTYAQLVRETILNYNTERFIKGEISHHTYLRIAQEASTMVIGEQKARRAVLNEPSAVQEIFLRTKEQRVVLFATCLYDNYYKTFDVNYAISKAMVSVGLFGDEMELIEYHDIIKNYPFLITKEHLEDTIELMLENDIQFACLLTQNGIHENYKIS